ncbi:cathepsin O-like [Amphiura filiformis]|uniref:cathepsin O-like n=1 Tax=Amphiura filiformis TaxID=82378 RepID=UPI003B2253F3
MDKYQYVKTMGLLLLYVICTSVRHVSTNTIDNNVTSDQSYGTFKDFINMYNKTYSSSEELRARFDIFKQSLERHRALNAARTHPHDALYGVTQFSDMTPQEFSASVLGHRSLGGQKASALKPNFQFLKIVKDVDPKFDWRTHKPAVVTKVRDQGSCGGCWAFSIVECMETQYALKTGKLIELSPQQLIDCADTPPDHGCGGGNLCATLEWLLDTNQTMVTEKKYPYKAKTGTCKHYTSTDVKVVNYTCRGYHDMTHQEDMMVSLLNHHGPLAVAVDATSWQDYIGGIIQHHCYDRYDNHAVQIVGYDKTGPVPYYIVRNSWGSKFGLNGYLNIKIGDNLCGIANTVGSLDVQ